MIARKPNPILRIYPQISKDTILNLKQIDNPKLEHIYQYYLLAFEAEIAEKWERADFYWKNTLSATKQLILPEKEAKLSNDQLDIQSFIKEILIDSFCAFYNNYGNKKEKKQYEKRSNAILKFLEETFLISNLSETEQDYILMPLFKQDSLDAVEAKNWKKVASISKKALAKMPNNKFFQKEIITAYYFEIIENLNKKKSNHQYHINQLEKGIKKIEDIRLKNPYLNEAYYYLADLHQVLAVKQTHVRGKMSEALVSMQKALVYDPFLKDGQKLLNQLYGLMKEVIGYSTQIKAQLQRQYNAQLSPEGQLMVNDANKGYAPSDNYVKSTAAQKIKAQRETGIYREVWEGIGLDTNISDLNYLSKKLFWAIEHIKKNRPESIGALPRAWNITPKDDLELSSAEDELVLVYLREFLFDIAPLEKQELTPNYFLIETAPSDSVPSGLPLKEWFWSKQDLRLKLQAAAAIALVLLASILFAISTHRYNQRNLAYNNLLIAQKQAHYSQVMDEAVTFLEHPPFGKHDNRTEEVKAFYSETFVKWFLTQNEEDLNSESKYVNSYHLVID